MLKASSVDNGNYGMENFKVSFIAAIFSAQIIIKQDRLYPQLLQNCSQDRGHRLSSRCWDVKNCRLKF